MKKVILAVLVPLAAAAVLAAPASAALRVPQITLSDNGAALQPQINILNGAGIDVKADQEDYMRWKKNISGVGTLTLSFAVGADLGTNSIGVYNAVNDAGQTVSGSEMFEIFPEGTLQGWHAVAVFGVNTLDVTLFDGAVQQGLVKHYTGVDVNDFGFYVKNGSDVGFGQDLLNTNQEARVLVYAGTGAKNGGWFVCFENGVEPIPTAQFTVDHPEHQDFDEAVLFVEAVGPVPTSKSTWAALKSRFR